MMAVRREEGPLPVGMTQQEFAQFLDMTGRMKAQGKYEAFAGVFGHLPDREKIREEMLGIMKQIVDFDDAIMSGAVEARKAELEARVKILQVIEGIAKSELSGQASIQSSQIGAKQRASQSFLQEVGISERIKNLELSKAAKDSVLRTVLTEEWNTKTAVPGRDGFNQESVEANFREILNKHPQEMGKIMRFVNDKAKNPELQKILVGVLANTTTADEIQRQSLAVDEEYRQIDDILEEANSKLQEELGKGGVSGSASFRAIFRQLDKLMPGVLQPDGSIDIDVKKMRESLPRDENGKVPSIVALETQLAALQNDPTYEDLRRELLDDPATAAFAKSVGLEGAPADMIIKKARQLHRKAYRKMKREARRGGESGSFWDEYAFLGPPERDEEPVVDPTEGATKAAQATEGSGAQEASSAAAAGARRKAAAVKQQAELYPEKDIYGAFQDSSDVSPVKSKAEAQKRVDEAVKDAAVQASASHPYFTGTDTGAPRGVVQTYLADPLKGAFGKDGFFQLGKTAAAQAGVNLRQRNDRGGPRLTASDAMRDSLGVIDRPADPIGVRKPADPYLTPTTFVEDDLAGSLQAKMKKKKNLLKK